jgi:hypothetical protein
MDRVMARAASLESAEKVGSVHSGGRRKEDKHRERLALAENFY